MMIQHVYAMQLVRLVKDQLAYNVYLATQIRFYPAVNVLYVRMENMVVILLLIACLATKNAIHAKDH